MWVHTLQVVDQARTRVDDLSKPERLAVMLGAVCHDLGKPSTTAFIDGRIRSMNHEEQGVAPAAALLDRLNVNSIGGFDVRRNYGPVTVPAGHYFMMGDNRDNSQDSRYWGFMPRDYVKGKALFVYFSFGDNPGGATSVRWTRMLHQIH